jgi:hypothetical protein
MQGCVQLEAKMLRPALLAALILAAPAAAIADDCEPGFASLLPRVVKKEAVAAVDQSYEINFWQFCKGREFHDLGNAAALTRTIAANPYLAGPIEQKDWRVDDVKFVRIENGRVDLWLHRDP